MIRKYWWMFLYVKYYKSQIRHIRLSWLLVWRFAKSAWEKDHTVLPYEAAHDQIYKVMKAMEDEKDRRNRC